MSKKCDISHLPFCLVCNSPLTEPFPESENLLHRNSLLFQTFSKYLELESKSDIISNSVISKEFPFCTPCRLTLVELKALDTEIVSLLSRAHSIQRKLTAKILESEYEDIFQKSSPNNPAETGIVDRSQERPEDPDLQFSQTVYNHVKSLRNTIIHRYDVAVKVGLLKEEGLPVAGLFPREEQETKNTKNQDQDRNDPDRSNNYSGDVQMEDFSPTEDVASDHSEVEMDGGRPDRELTPPTLSKKIDSGVKREGGEGEEDEYEDQKKRKKEEADSDFSESTSLESESETDEDEGTLGRRRTRAVNKSGRENRKTQDEDGGPSSSKKGKYVTLSPGVFLFADKYQFELKEGVYSCCLCGYRTEIHARILTHLRVHAKYTERRVRKKLVKITPTKWMYANKYEVEASDRGFVCKLCGVRRKGRYKLIDHIRKVHIKKILPARKKRSTKDKIQSKRTDSTEDDGLQDTSKSKKSESTQEVLPNLELEKKFVLQNASIDSSKYVTLRPGVFLFADKYEFELKEGTYSCSLCGYRTQLHTRILTHLRVHAKYKERRVRKKLVKITPTTWMYANRYEIETNDNGFVCKLCGVTRKRNYKMLQHIRAVHVKGLTSAQKPRKILPNSTDSKSAAGATDSGLSGRSKEISPGKWLFDDTYPFEREGNIFRCGNEACADRKFRHLQSVTAHVWKYHREKRNRIKEIEPNKFLYKGKYHIHLKDGSYICPVCGFSRPNVRHTCDHIRKVHADEEEPYMCDVCGKVLASRSTLRTHALKHEDPNRPDSIICHVCGKGFKCKGSLPKHLELHKDTFECDICGEKFPTDLKFRSHRSIHTGEKTFKCDRCSKAYKTYKGLRQHQERYHSKVPCGSSDEDEEGGSNSDSSSSSDDSNANNTQHDEEEL